LGKAENHCVRCSGVLVRGSLRIDGLHQGPMRVALVIPGVPTSSNPIKAFKQGLAGEPGDEVIPLDDIVCLLCRSCGHLEWRAWIDDGPEEI